MSDSLTLAQLRTEVRRRADMVVTGFVIDAEVNSYINLSYKSFYDILIDANEDYFITQYSFTIASGNTQTVPTDFYKLRGLDDVSDANNPITVRKYNFTERNSITNNSFFSNTGYLSDVFYRLLGNQLFILPPSKAQRPYTMWYTPIPADLVNDTDVAIGINGWLEYVILDAAIKCLDKEESNVEALSAQREDVKKRIISMKRDRDQAYPEKVARVRNRNVFNIQSVNIGLYE